MGKAVSVAFTLRTYEQSQDTPSLLESDHRDAERGQVSESRRYQKFGEHIRPPILWLNDGATPQVPPTPSLLGPGQPKECHPTRNF